MEKILTTTLNDQAYAVLATRVKALFVDSLIFIIMMMIFSSLFSAFETIPDGLRIATMVFIFLFSLLTVQGSGQRKAIYDMLVGSLVVYADISRKD